MSEAGNSKLETGPHNHPQQAESNQAVPHAQILTKVLQNDTFREAGNFTQLMPSHEQQKAARFGLGIT